MRHLSVTLLIGTVLVAAAAAGTLLRQSDALGTSSQTAWERWREMSLEERWPYVKAYQQVATRRDSREILANAREYGELSADAQARLRSLQQLQAEVLQQQHSTRRRLLISLPPKARAFELMRIIEEDHPERLRALRSGSEDSKRQFAG